jgi:hypothetical protein
MIVAVLLTMERSCAGSTIISQGLSNTVETAVGLWEQAARDGRGVLTMGRSLRWLMMSQGRSTAAHAQRYVDAPERA